MVNKDSARVRWMATRRSPSSHRVGQLLTLAAALLLTACMAVAPYSPTAPATPVGLYQNPTLIPYRNPDQLWELVADVVDDYFEIDNEQPVRLIGGVITEGRLETRPTVASTLLEPWRGDSVGFDQRLEATLQSERRFAQVRVLPGEGGFWVDVAVFKELEDVVRPESSPAGGVTFYNDTSLTRVVNPVGPQEAHRGWIPMGRDPLLEQRIIAQIHDQLSGRSPVFSTPKVAGP
jgi:hypothetical protein